MIDSVIRHFKTRQHDLNKQYSLNSEFSDVPGFSSRTLAIGAGHLVRALEKGHKIPEEFQTAALAIMDHSLACIRKDISRIADDRRKAGLHEDGPALSITRIFVKIGDGLYGKYILPEFDLARLILRAACHGSIPNDVMFEISLYNDRRKTEIGLGLQLEEA